MNCAACGHANPERAKFCLECGTPIAARCASCGTELPPAAEVLPRVRRTAGGYGVGRFGARGCGLPPTPTP